MARRYTGPIVDVDIHHGWKRQSDIIAYLPERWQEYASANPREHAVDLNAGATLVGHSKRTSVVYNVPRRENVDPPDGSPAGTDYATLREHILDRYNIYRGVLTYNTGGHVNTHNRDFGVAVARAVHDWNAETWLSFDDRLYGVVCPTMAWPEEAAKEIRRIGGHPKIVAMLLPGGPVTRPWGDPMFHPVYEAAAELGLTIHLHVGATVAEQPPGGIPISATGAMVCESQQPMHHITSFIVNGVFEKFPTLKVIIKEFGTAWLPYLMWRLDKNYDLLRLESPWVKRWPSEYIHDHIRLDTQPLEEGWHRGDLEQVLTTIDGIEDMLMFATDYPHGAQDEPHYVSARLPQAWLRKVMCVNACACYGWAVPPQSWRGAAPAMAVAGAA